MVLNGEVVIDQLRKTDLLYAGADQPLIFHLKLFFRPMTSLINMFSRDYFQNYCKWS